MEDEEARGITGRRVNPIETRRRILAPRRLEFGLGSCPQAVRRMRWTPLSVLTMLDSSPTLSRNVASSNGFCI